MRRKNLKPELNRVLEKMKNEDNSHAINEELLNAECRIIWRDEPFAHINNFTDSLKTLSTYSAWISYGGLRTGSTFVTMAMRILLSSMVDIFLTGWEGDYKEPQKFFELAQETPGIEAGILKIHRYEKFCNKLLKQDRAKAVVSTRDYQSIAGSYTRMKANRHSPFFQKQKVSDQQLLDFIGKQIEDHKKKREIPNTLFIRESEIRQNPGGAVSRIAGHMGLHLTATSTRYIGEKLNIESQKKTQQKTIINSTGHGESNFMHHEHINTTEEGYENKFSELIFAHFGKELGEDGYLK
ncbi:hypothetical protein KR52_01510 [Synechococcus sp. KORDI-52]|nr:hypothetical protein KR52_01510 [Synechococcus sp. KORDI-52]